MDHDESANEHSQRVLTVTAAGPGSAHPCIACVQQAPGTDPRLVRTASDYTSISTQILYIIMYRHTFRFSNIIDIKNGKIWVHTFENDCYLIKVIGTRQVNILKLPWRTSRYIWALWVPKQSIYKHFFEVLSSTISDKGPVFQNVVDHAFLPVPISGSPL